MAERNYFFNVIISLIGNFEQDRASFNTSHLASADPTPSLLPVQPRGKAYLGSQQQPQQTPVWGTALGLCALVLTGICTQQEYPGEEILCLVGAGN